MAVCCCSLAGTAACRTCSNNPNAETPPPVRTYTTIVTDGVLMTGQKTNADRIRAMTDEQLAEYLSNICYDFWKMFVDDPKKMWLDWLKSPVEVDNG